MSHRYYTQDRERLIAERHKRMAIPRPCRNPACENTVTGQSNRAWCSAKCRNKINNRRPTREYEKARIERLTAENLAAAPSCSICEKTTARKGQHKPDPELLAKVPEGVHLCKTHLRGFSLFMRQNNYDGQDKDDVFSAYLVSKTFTSTIRIPYLHMMREAFASRQRRLDII